MSRNNEFDDYDDEDEDEAGNGPKDLRRALSKANKQNAEMAKQLEELTKKLASQSLSSLLSEKKVPANIQRWMKRDEVEPTAEAVDTWLKENGADFGWKPEGEPTQETHEETPAQQSVLSDEDVAAQQRLQQMGSEPNAELALDQGQAKVDNIAAKIDLDTDFNAVARMLQEAGIPIEGQTQF